MSNRTQSGGLWLTSNSFREKNEGSFSFLLAFWNHAVGAKRSWSKGQTRQQSSGKSPTRYHLLRRISWASADPTAHSLFILGLESEIVNLQEERITLHTSI